MPVQERLRRLGRVGFDEDGIRVRQVQAEVVDPRLGPAQIDVRFAEINLRPSRRVRQRNEHLPLPQPLLGNELPHHRIAALVAVLVTQPFEDPFGGMALLLENFPVGLQDLMNDADKRPQLGRYRRFSALVSRRHRVLKHLRYRRPADPKSLCRCALAHALHQHGASYLGVEVHVIHPFCLPPRFIPGSQDRLRISYFSPPPSGLLSLRLLYTTNTSTIGD